MNPSNNPSGSAPIIPQTFPKFTEFPSDVQDLVWSTPTTSAREFQSKSDSFTHATTGLNFNDAFGTWALPNNTDDLDLGSLMSPLLHTSTGARRAYTSSHVLCRLAADEVAFVDPDRDLIRLNNIDGATFQASRQTGAGEWTDPTTGTRFIHDDVNTLSAEQRSLIPRSYEFKIYKIVVPGVSWKEQVRNVEFSAYCLLNHHEGFNDFVLQNYTAIADYTDGAQDVRVSLDFFNMGNLTDVGNGSLLFVVYDDIP